MNVEPTKCPNCGRDLTTGTLGHPRELQAEYPGCEQDLVCTGFHEKCGYYLPAEARELARALDWDNVESIADILQQLAFCDWDDPDVRAKWKALQDRMASDCQS